MQKNLLKLYLNDVGMLTGRLYEYNIAPVMKQERSVNLGSVYESVVAQELKAHGHNLYYYDNAKKGEVDFLVNNGNEMTVLSCFITGAILYSYNRPVSIPTSLR